MSRFLIIALTLIVANSLYCQNYALTLENDEKDKEKNYPINLLIKKDGTSQMICVRKKNVLSVINYTQDLKILSVQELNLKEIEKQKYEASYINSNDEVFLIFSKVENKKNYYNLYSLNGDGKLNISSKKELFTELSEYAGESKLKVFSSENNNNIYLINKMDKNFLFGGKNSIRLYKLDNTGTSIEWNKTLSDNEKLKDMDIIALMVSNTSGFMLHFQKSNKDINTFRWYDDKANVMHESSIGSDSKFFDEVYVVQKMDGSFDITGFYSNKKNMNKVHGIASFNYSLNSDKITKQYDYDLSSELLANIYKEKKAEKFAEKGLPNDYKIRKIIRDKDGNHIFVAEMERIETSTNSMPSTGMTATSGGMGMGRAMTTNRTYLINGSVLIFSMSSKGKLLWSDAILKEQKVQIGMSRGYGSDLGGIALSYSFRVKSAPEGYLPLGLFTFEDKEKLYIAFNDSEKNFKYQTENDNDKKKTKVTTNFNKADLYIYSVNKDNGQSNIKEVFDGKTNKFTIYPKTTVKLDDANYIIYANKGSKDALGKLKINNPNIQEEDIPLNKAPNNKNESKSNQAPLSQNNPDNKSNSTPANTSAIAHGEARTPSAAVAKTYKYKADEKSVEYYNELRKKFEEEEKIRKEKEAQLAVEKGKKEEEIKQGRRLTEDQAPQFDRFRQGEKNPVVKKTTAEEDYKTLFK